MSEFAKGLRDLESVFDRLLGIDRIEEIVDEISSRSVLEVSSGESHLEQHETKVHEPEG